MKEVKSRDDFLKLDDYNKRYALEFQSLSWFDRDDFEQSNDNYKRYALKYQPLRWLNRDDFEQLDDFDKWYALLYQSLSWFNREDFAKLNDYNKRHALEYQSLSWFVREDFEQLDDYSKHCALVFQSLSWFNRDDFEKLDDDNKKLAVNQFPKTEKNKRKEAEAYASRHNLKIDQNYLYAFRDHNKRGAGMFLPNICYEMGKYYKDWHCDIQPEVENSFGYGIWSYGNTKVRVKIEDWGVEVADAAGGKARVWGFEVIE